MCKVKGTLKKTNLNINGKWLNGSEVNSLFNAFTVLAPNKYYSLENFYSTSLSNLDGIPIPHKNSATSYRRYLIRLSILFKKGKYLEYYLEAREKCSGDKKMNKGLIEHSLLLDIKYIAELWSRDKKISMGFIDDYKGILKFSQNSQQDIKKQEDKIKRLQENKKTNNPARLAKGLVNAKQQLEMLKAFKANYQQINSGENTHFYSFSAYLYKDSNEIVVEVFDSLKTYNLNAKNYMELFKYTFKLILKAIKTTNIVDENIKVIFKNTNKVRVVNAKDRIPNDVKLISQIDRSSCGMSSPTNCLTRVEKLLLKGDEVFKSGDELRTKCSKIISTANEVIENNVNLTEDHPIYTEFVNWIKLPVLAIKNKEQNIPAVATKNKKKNDGGINKKTLAYIVSLPNLIVFSLGSIIGVSFSYAIMNLKSINKKIIELSQKIFNGIVKPQIIKIIAPAVVAIICGDLGVYAKTALFNKKI